MSDPAAWDIVHVNLSEGVRPLAATDGSRGVYLVAWWGDIPLGDWYLYPASLPMTAREVAELASRIATDAVGTHLLGPAFSRGLAPGTVADAGGPPLSLAELTNLERPLTRLAAQTAAATAETISIVICTRDRPEALSRCLHALQRLDEQPHEIVVVDNASATGATQEVVASAPGVRYVQEPRPGLDVARNAGVRHSTGSVVAFTDDDVELHPRWLLGLRRGFYAPEVMAVTGLILPTELETEAQVIFEKHWSFNRGFAPKTFGPAFFESTNRRGVPVWNVGAGANMAFRREVFPKVGYFDARLDVGAAGCSGDSEFWFRILAEGWRCRYEPCAVAFHTHRRDMVGLKQQLHAYMRGNVAAHLVQYEKYRCRGDLRRLLLTLPKWYLRLVLRRLRRGHTHRTKTLGPELTGAASGVLFYLQHRSAPADAVAPVSPVLEDVDAE